MATRTLTRIRKHLDVNERTPYVQPLVWVETPDTEDTILSMAPPVHVLETMVRPKPRRAPLVFGGLGVAAMLALGTAWAVGRSRQSTDNAQIEGRITHVAPRVGGQVIRVHVQDNQLVEVNQLLIELDHRDLDARLEAARADLAAARAGHAAAQAQLALTEKTVSANRRQASGGVAQASAGVVTSGANIAQARADVSAARARLGQTQLDFDRATVLAEKASISTAELDARRSVNEQAAAGLAQAHARLAAARASTAGARGALAVAEGRELVAASGDEQMAMANAALDAAAAKVAQAEAAARLAELAASYTYVRAPSRGVVSRRTVEVGQLATPERPLLALVSPDDLWVVANFKEDQIGEMKLGARAHIRVDAFGRRELAGHVESVASASGARFALLPPDNASGNFTKVVQRVPVLIRIDDARGLTLRPGLSAVATVETR
jgi:membrane fusion protein (multidrug efflux system)